MVNMISLIKDRRNPIYFLDLLKNKKKNKDIKKVYFSFTLDLEKNNKSELDHKQLDNILNLLKNYGTGTFFVETSLLKNYSLTLDKNEVGSHGYGHLALGNDWWISKEEKSINIEKNIKKSTDLIKDAFKVNPLSFRSPKFSSDKSLNKILLKYGYKIDSSTTPHNGKFLPSINQNLLQIPVSRYYKPKLRLKYGIPFLNYESLMFSNLKTMGVNKFENLTKKIIETFDNKNKVILNFMCHNWDFSTQKDISIVEEYLNNLEKRFKIEFIPLKKYYKKFY